MNGKIKQHSFDKDNASFKPRQVRNNVLAKAVALALMAGGVALPASSFAGSISGYKFLDTFDTGNGVKANGVRDDQDILLENHMIILQQNGRKLTDQMTDDNGHYSFPNLSDGTYQLSINIPRETCSTSPTVDINGEHSRNINYEITIKDGQNRDIDIGIAACVDLPRPEGMNLDGACNNPTIQSEQSGGWNTGNIWSEGRVPSAGDRVKINSGHAIVMPIESVDLGTSNLCNEGTITNTANTREFTNNIEIHARVINNRGKIEGQAGVDGNCSVRGTAASKILLFASQALVNETWDAANEAIISTDNGGTSYTGVCPDRWNVYAGDGGGIEIKAGVIKNYSNISAGDGGNAGISRHGLAVSGKGGYVLVSSDNVNDSENTGTITTGKGGWSKGYRAGTRYSTGGNVVINLGDFNGEIVGAPGSSIWGDPINLNFGADFKIRDFEDVNLYTDEGGTIDFTKVNENTFSNIKVISIATKSLNGEGGSIDLRGISGTIFKAAEKVEIFADNILLDDGVDINDLIDAPEVVIEAGKLIYHVQLTADQYVVGEPDSAITIPVQVFNGSPKNDSYTFTITDSEGWNLGTIADVSVEALKSAEVNLNVTLPSERAANNEITITATSKTKSDVISEAKIHAMVHAGVDSDGDEAPDVLDAFPDDPTEWRDDDNDGVGNNIDTDDDGDGMLDTWENKYEGLSSVVNDADDDLDEDGFSNLLESQANTDPTDPNSKPVVEPENIPPTAVFSITPNTGEAPLTVALDASSSSDTDGTITSYKWTASDGQTAEGQNAQLTFNEAGNYTISLEVMDDKGTTNSATSNVSATAPAVVGKYETSGTIKDSSGQPISNATVKVGDKIVITDEAGYWEVNGLSDKNYQVEFSKDGYDSKTSTCIFSENQETCQLNFKPESLLDIKETYNSRTAEQGANITYRFIVTNNGKTTATGITLQDILPADTELVSIKSLADSPCDENSISCIIPDLPPKAATSVEVIIRNTQATALISTASVTSNEYPTDVHTTKTNITPYLSLDITDTPDPLQMGQATLNYKFNIDLNQYSSSSATDIQLNTELPEVMEFKTITSDDATCDTSKLPTITCTIPELTVDNPDKSSHATIDMEVEVQDAGLLVAILDGKVTANEYPDHSNRERTQIFVPLEYQVDMAVVIDVTGSMQQEMNGIKAALRKFMEEIGADQFPLSALVVFRDDVTIKAITSDMNNLIASIDKMKASGGDACEEASIEALDKAIAHVKEGGTIFFVTDASPYNDADVEGVVERLNAKNIKIKPVVTGDCSDRSSWNLPE